MLALCYDFQMELSPAKELGFSSQLLVNAVWLLIDQENSATYQSARASGGDWKKDDLPRLGCAVTDNWNCFRSKSKRPQVYSR